MQKRWFSHHSMETIASMKSILSLATILAASLPFAPLAIAQTYLPEQRPSWCKNEVADRYDTYLADISITSNASGNNVTWMIESTGRTGSCQFNDNNAFVSITGDNTYPHYGATGYIYWSDDANAYIAPDGGICYSCTPENGFPVPPETLDGFFYLPNEMHWFDSSGELCATCTPENGFPVPPR
jgi:hypothetical protein